jgi:Protein of unknown function (DUF1566)
MYRVRRIASMAVAAVALCCGASGCGAAKLKQCESDLASCQKSPRGQLLRTGQRTCYDGAGLSIPCAGTGQDGEFQKGLARTYIDNGDGTVTDTNTGLMWEKKSDDGSIHDQDDLYTWAAAFTVFIAALNSGAGFAGHSDWRLPNINELRSIAYGESPTVGCTNPAVDAAFNTNCTPGCTVTTCSCQWSLASLYYWSSTTYTDPPTDNDAWGLLFWCGGWTVVYPKTQTFCVRAVRGGS